MSRSFQLAPMSSLIKWVTVALWVMPVAFAIAALISREPFMGIVSALLFAMYGAVWFCCRPSRFIVSEDSIDILFLLWRRKISRQTITNVRTISKKAFQQEFGWAIRIGVGGLWGGFGWLWTTKRGMVEFYVSHLDEFVLLERSPKQTLLITPIHPTEFIRAMQCIEP
ncbi:MAG: PH domain-containing protein [Cyanobacteria bacterium P01_A01_bin.37]